MIFVESERMSFVEENGNCKGWNISPPPKSYLKVAASGTYVLLKNTQFHQGLELIVTLAILLKEAIALKILHNAYIF